VALFPSSYLPGQAMNTTIRFTFAALVCSSFVLLAGCDQNKPTAQQQGASVAQLVGDAAPAADANKPADPPPPHAAPAYTPPTAAQLISLLAPIAVFPDKLVAQVLAASSYPDEITQANGWLAQNSSLKGDALQQAIDKQDWDPSVKAIVVFPDVLHQMANNVPWTTALGEAYVNDPNDVMNAIQALRAQALACNNLKSNKYITVTKTAKNTTTPTEQYVDEAPSYSGPPVIPPPDDVIEIEPAQPDYVYVPYFNPVSYYGAPIDVWPGYYYAWPAPVYWGPSFAFGLGIWIGSYHHWGWGWHHWDVGWGRGFDRHWGDRGWRNASVVFNNRPYVSRSTTVINRFDAGGGFAGGRANFDPAARTAALRPGMTGNAGFAPHTAPTDFNRLSRPQFTAAMAQRSAVAATRAGFAPGRSSMAETRPGGLASSSFVSSPVSRSAQTFDRPGALPSSRYVPASMRGGYDGSSRGPVGGGQARSFASAPQRQAYDGGYRTQSAPRGMAQGPSMQRSFSAPQSMARSYSGPSRSYAAPSRSYAPPASLRGPAPMASRSFANAPRAQAPHYSAPRSAPSGGGGGRAAPNGRHR